MKCVEHVRDAGVWDAQAWQHAVCDLPEQPAAHLKGQLGGVGSQSGIRLTVSSIGFHLESARYLCWILALSSGDIFKKTVSGEVCGVGSSRGCSADDSPCCFDPRVAQQHGHLG
jgi:hypothetical protein